jgi:hypothetical protein
MAEFVITKSAVAEIWQRLRDSALARPFVILGESSDDLSLSDGFMSALTSGAADAELDVLAKAEYERIAPGLKLYLAVLIYDVDKHRPANLVDIAGLPFDLDSQMRSILAGYELDHMTGRFVLRKDGNVFANLRSLPGADAAT